jgi:hypothetical protein
MISDSELNSITIYFGMLSVGLVLVYAVIETNFKGVSFKKE